MQLDLRREVRNSLAGFADALPAEQRHPLPFARAMFLRLSPVRRIVLLFAAAMLVTYLAGAEDSGRLLMCSVALLLLLAMEIADRITLKRDLEVAREIQQWLVPHSPPRIPGLDVAFQTKPANTVAGDYYDVLQLGASVLFVVADVAGKGIPAGLLMAGFRSCLHTLAESATGLQELGAPLQHFCCDDSNQGRRFTSAFLAQYEPGILRYLNAGHNPPLLRRATGEILALEAGSVPFGMFRNTRYAVAEAAVGPGDVLLIYTDGVVEAVNDAGQEFGMERLSDFMSEKSESAAEIQDHLLQTIRVFTAGARQHDDITTLVVRFG